MVPDTARETYIDPMIYVDVVDAVKAFANEIDPASLSLEHLIGTGIKSYILFYFIPFLTHLINNSFDNILCRLSINVPSQSNRGIRTCL